MPSTLLALVLALAEPLAGRPARVHVHPRIRPQPPAAASVPKMRYYGGRVLQDAQLVAVLWGPPLPADLQARLDAWYAAFVCAPQWQWLGEYGTAGVAVEGGGAGTNQRLNPPTYLGSFVVQPANQRTTLSEPELEAELAAQID